MPNPYHNDPRYVDRSEYFRRQREEQARRYQREIEGQMERAAIRRAQLAQQEQQENEQDGGGSFWDRAKDWGNKAQDAVETVSSFIPAINIGRELGQTAREEGPLAGISRAWRGLTSGEEYLNLSSRGDPGTAVRGSIERNVPYGRQVAGTLDAVVNPATIIPGAAGPRLAMGAARFGMAGRPISVAFGNAVEGNIVRRLAGEAAIGTGAYFGGEAAVHALPEGTPGTLRFGAQLGGGLLGAGVGGATFRGVTRGRGAGRQQLPEPAAVPRDETPIDPRAAELMGMDSSEVADRFKPGYGEPRPRFAENEDYYPGISTERLVAEADKLREVIGREIGRNTSERWNAQNELAQIEHVLRLREPENFGLGGIEPDADYAEVRNMGPATVAPSDTWEWATSSPDVRAKVGGRSNYEDYTDSELIRQLDNTRDKLRYETDLNERDTLMMTESQISGELRLRQQEARPGGILRPIEDSAVKIPDDELIGALSREELVQDLDRVRLNIDNLLAQMQDPTVHIKVRQATGKFSLQDRLKNEMLRERRIQATLERRPDLQEPSMLKRIRDALLPEGPELAAVPRDESPIDPRTAELMGLDRPPRDAGFGLDEPVPDVSTFDSSIGRYLENASGDRLSHYEDFPEYKDLSTEELIERWRVLDQQIASSQGPVGHEVYAEKANLHGAIRQREASYSREMLRETDDVGQGAGRRGYTSQPEALTENEFPALRQERMDKFSDEELIAELDSAREKITKLRANITDSGEVYYNSLSLNDALAWESRLDAEYQRRLGASSKRPGIGNVLRRVRDSMLPGQEPQAVVPMDRTPLDPRAQELIGGDRATNQFATERGPYVSNDPRTDAELHQAVMDARHQLEELEGVGYNEEYAELVSKMHKAHMELSARSGKTASGRLNRPGEAELEQPDIISRQRGHSSSVVPERLRAAHFPDLADDRLNLSREQTIDQLAEMRDIIKELQAPNAPEKVSELNLNSAMRLESKLAAHLRKLEGTERAGGSLLSRMSDKLLDIFVPEGPTSSAVKGSARGAAKSGAQPPSGAVPPTAPPPTAAGTPPSGTPPRKPRVTGTKPPAHELVEPQIPKPGLTTGDRTRGALNNILHILDRGGVKEHAVATPIAHEAVRQKNVLTSQGTHLEGLGDRVSKALQLDKTGFSKRHQVDIQDMAWNYDTWRPKLQPHEQEIMDRLRTDMQKWARTMKEYGIKLKQKQTNGKEGFYVPRGSLTDKWDATGIQAGRFVNQPKGTVKRYLTKADGKAAGVEYGDLTSALRTYTDEVSKLTTERWLSDQIKIIGPQLTPGKAGVGKVPIKGAGNVELPIEVADLLTKRLREMQGNVPKGDVQRLVDNVNRTAKSLWTTFDLSFAGIQGLLGAAVNPKAGIRAFNVGIQSALDPAFMDKWVAGFDAAQAAKGGTTSVEWRKLGLHRAGKQSRGLDISHGGALQGFQTLPGIRHISTAFSSSGDAMRYMLAAQAEGVAKFAKQPVDKAAIARGANRATGFTHANALGDVGDAALFAPRFLVSQIEMLSKALSPKLSDTEVNMARAQLGALIGTGVALTVMINEANGEKTVFNPDDSNFMRIRNVGGTDISVFGPWDSMVRGLTKTVTERDPLYLARTKASPLVSLTVDLLTGENIVGEKTRTPEYMLRSLLPLSMRDAPIGVGDSDMTPTQAAAGFFGLKSSPLTGQEELTNRLKDAGINEDDPDYLIKRRDYLAEHPEYRAKAGSDETQAIYDVQDDVQAREALNEERAISGEQTLTEFRTARKGLLKERRLRLEPLVEDIGNKPKTQQERWLKSYFELFEQEGVTDPVTGDIVADKFDEAEAKWLGTVPAAAYDFIQRYVLAGSTPVEREYITDMQTLSNAGYFDIEKYTGLESEATDDELEKLRQQVSSARATNPELRDMEFEDAARLILKQNGFDDAIIADVIWIGKDAAMSDELRAMKALFGKELLWFNPNVFWEDYQSYIPGQEEIAPRTRGGFRSRERGRR